jgi:hypothetical protein
MYPVNVSLPGGLGFAVANSEAEHAALSAAGYEPMITGPQEVSSPPVLLAPGVSGDLIETPAKRRPKKVQP